MAKVKAGTTAIEHLAERVRAILGPDPRIAEKAMFGSLAFLLNGHILVGVRKDGSMLVSVGKGFHDEAIAISGVTPMVMQGREMKGFVQVDADATESEDALEFWLRTSERWVATLPLK